MANSGTGKPSFPERLPRRDVVPKAPSPVTPATLSPEAALKCRAELRTLTALIDQHRRSADSEGKAVCLFVDEKLAAASAALDRGDGDGSWLQLFGAATMCRTFQIQPKETERTLARLNSMLG